MVFGHSHRYSETVQEGRLWLNPGSCGPRRPDQEITFAIVTVEGTRITAEKRCVAHPPRS